MENDEGYTTNDTNYPPKPIQPADEDCCGSGCSTCVFDLYDLELSRWQQRCEEIDNGACEEKSAEELISVYDYREFRLCSIECVSEVMVYYKFEIPGNKKLPLKHGQHLIARCADEVNGHHVIRPYTPVSKPSQKGFFEIAVKLYNEGKMSRCMRKWTVGSFIEWRGPFSEHNYIPNTCQQILLIAGGTGVTPMLQYIQQILSNDEDETKVCLLYSVHSVKELIKKTWLDEWKQYWNFKVRYFVTGEQEKDHKDWKYGDQVSLQHIDREILISLTGQQGKFQRVFICGPKAFNSKMLVLSESVLKIPVEHIVEFY